MSSKPYKPYVPFSPLCAGGAKSDVHSGLHLSTSGKSRGGAVLTLVSKHWFPWLWPWLCDVNSHQVPQRHWCTCAVHCQCRRIEAGRRCPCDQNNCWTNFTSKKRFHRKYKRVCLQEMPSVMVCWSTSQSPFCLLLTYSPSNRLQPRKQIKNERKDNDMSIWLYLFTTTTKPNEANVVSICLDDHVFEFVLYILTPRIGYSEPPPPPPPRVKSMSRETKLLLLQLKSMFNTLSNG